MRNISCIIYIYNFFNFEFLRKKLYLRREKRKTETCRKKIIIPRVLELFNNLSDSSWYEANFQRKEIEMFWNVVVVPCWPGHHCHIESSFSVFRNGNTANVYTLPRFSSLYGNLGDRYFNYFPLERTSFGVWLNSFSLISSKEPRMNLDSGSSISLFWLSTKIHFLYYFLFINHK